ncbi:hypothetical protein ACHQM5_029793 [Ranunculus cassubicifolius]
MSSSSKMNHNSNNNGGVIVTDEKDEPWLEDKDGIFEYFGWVYHLGVNSIGHEYCHLRYLFVRGKYVKMFKRDPHDYADIKPIRKGIVSHTLMVEELGRKKVAGGDLYVIRFYNRLDETKKGEIACATAGEARKWMEAFDQAKQQAEYELSKGARSGQLNAENELNLVHRPRVRRYAHGLRKLIRIGQGPESLLRQSSDLGRNIRSDGYLESDSGDVVEAHEWKCVRAINGIRIFEDVAGIKTGKSVLVKSVGVVDANLDTVFEVILSLDRRRRYEWDMFTSNLELVDSLNGHYDVVYGTYDPKYLTRWHSKRDFVFSRQWFRGQDGAYTILQFPSTHKKRPHKSGYRRININPSTWEIRSLSAPEGSNVARCLVTQMLEINCSGWFRWKKDSKQFEKSIPYALLCQVAGLREYFAANPSITVNFPATIVSKSSSGSSTNGAFEEEEVNEEFYDAIAADGSLEDEDSDSDSDSDSVKTDGKVTLKNVSWAIAGLAVKRHLAPVISTELNAQISPISFDTSQFHGCMRQGKDDTDSNCWMSPGGQEFMVRGKSYLKDNAKVMGGEPLLKLLAVDWFHADKCISKVAMHPKSLVQSEAGKKLPFILVVNLEVPAKPYYSLVLYYAADRPLNKESLLARFADGTDMFRDARFKLIPRIVEGYWMVKRAVGTKACLLGKAVTCNYFRQDNFLEIDVDIGSSSVAKSIISLVLGYVTSLVVDLAILIEAKEEEELPEYILGTVRLNRFKLDSAVSLEV